MHGERGSCAVKAAIVTGAGSGLGLQLAIALVDGGRRVIGVTRSSPQDHEFVHLVELGAMTHVRGDVSDSHTAELALAAAQELGGADLLINCAGAGIYGPAGSYSRRDLDDVFAGNLYGTILFSEAAFRVFRTEGGTIVNVMSTAAHVARANEAIYCASKWGARGYTESLRLEAKGSAATIVAVYPGGMNTPFWEVGRGSKVDPSKFMDPFEVAHVILSSLAEHKGTYVSDIIVNRK